MGFLYRLGFSIRVSSGHFCIFSVLGLSLGAGLIIDFVSVRDGLIIAPTNGQTDCGCRALHSIS